MRKFKTESKKLLDLMINSIYTNREIFLRELISNASDAVDKLYFKSLTDSSIQLTKDQLGIDVAFDKDARTITVSDNGIGMTQEDLDRNLGTIAHSDSMAFKQENAEQQGDDVDIIGQFGVGFYSAFMVAKSVRVVSKAYGSDQAWAWEIRRRRGLHHRGGPARGQRHRHHPDPEGQHRRGELRPVPQRVRPEGPHQALQQLRALPRAHGGFEVPPEAQARGRRRRLQARVRDSTPRSRPSTPWCRSGSAASPTYNRKSTTSSTSRPSTTSPTRPPRSPSTLRARCPTTRCCSSPAARRTTCTARTTRRAWSCTAPTC